MTDDQYIDMEGIVLQAKGNGMFTVSVNDGDVPVLCTLASNIRRFTIKIVEGDHVSIKVSVYDTSRGRITYRHKR